MATPNTSGGDMRASTILGLCAFILGSASASAFADDTAAPVKKQTVLTGITISSHKPVPVSVDVARMVERVPLKPLRRPLVDPTGAAIDKAPF
jgi:hypothetical protein